MKIPRLMTMTIACVILSSGLVACGKIWLSSDDVTIYQLDPSWTPEWASIVGLWHLDGTLGALATGATIVDSSVTQANGVMTNPNSLVVQSLIHQGIAFALSSKLSVPPATAPNPCSSMTFMFWINGTYPGAFANVIAKDGFATTNPGYVIQVQGAGNSIELRVDTSAASNQTVTWKSTDNFFDSQWHMILFTLNSGVVKMYMDGNFDSTGAYSQGGGFCNSTVGLTVGLSTLTYDEIALWNVALTSAEVSLIFARQVAAMNH